MLEERFVAALRLEETLEGVEKYVQKLPAVQSLMRMEELKIPAEVTFFVGENGTGKSTLLEALAIACGFNPEGGSPQYRFSSRDTHSSLARHLTVVRGVRRPEDGFFLRAESFYNVASEVDRLGTDLYRLYGGVSLHDHSHGESFLALVQNRFWGNGLYILDEPESALSPTGQFTLMLEIQRLVKSGSQVIAATHSPILMAYPGACIYELGEGGIRHTPYRETGHYQLTKRFLAHPERMLRELFEQG